MTLPAAARTRIEAAAGAAITSIAPLGGGQIASVSQIDLADGRRLVTKTGAGCGLEAWMLRYLAARTKLPVPQVHHAEDELLLMDFIAHDGRLDPLAETDLGDLVADLHGIEGQQFGFERDTLIGGLPQPNPPGTEWRCFFRDHRLLAMGRAALDAGRLPARPMARLETLCGKLDRWIGNEAKPALIHGDLWAGNILSRDGRIAGLIDPALYFADPEIELAFLTLFDSAGRRFFARYAQRRPLRPGFFEERRDLYNLYPLLVHTRLFGGSYAGQVESTLSRYGC